uniref:Uncharacterized protein n=1 Tax=Oryza punctata TaxID=4537 RepID=A0A0E0L130_ORYPU
MMYDNLYTKSRGARLGRGGATILGSGKNKVVGEDGERRSFLLILYKCGAHIVRLLPGMHVPKRSPITFIVGNNIYVIYIMEAAQLETLSMHGAEHCFEALVHSFPLAPLYVLDLGEDGPARVVAHAVVGNSQIWVSTEWHGMFSFDKALLFRGRTEHVPEHNVKFNFSPHDDGHLCTSDLTATLPSLRCTWRYRPSLLPHKGWLALVVSYLISLSGGRLCVTELFEMTRVEV